MIYLKVKDIKYQLRKLLLTNSLEMNVHDLSTCPLGRPPADPNLTHYAIVCRNSRKPDFRGERGNFRKKLRKHFKSDSPVPIQISIENVENVSDFVFLALQTTSNGGLV